MRKTLSAHRFAWELHFGPIPPGQQVLHRCDLRACVNPDHLFLGTQGDNVRDCVNKGRYHYRYGLDMPSGVLTDAEIAAIRSDPRIQRLIAADFSISQSHVSRIKSGEVRTHS